ncbi:hypothetical protein U0070_020705, partial [Myodes glareolus]
KEDSYSFGTRQQRKLFPHYHPPTWLGNKFLPLRGSPLTGPGCYSETDWNGLAHNLSRIPASTKGYVLGARTAARFKPVSKDVTPYPGMYQKVSTYNEKYKQSFAPFNVMMPRFTTEIKGASYPGPGTYNPEKKLPPKIVWPMKFGSPDWCQVPCLEKRTLKAEREESGRAAHRDVPKFQPPMDSSVFRALFLGCGGESGSRGWERLYGHNMVDDLMVPANRGKGVTHLNLKPLGYLYPPPK